MLHIFIKQMLWSHRKIRWWDNGWLSHGKIKSKSYCKAPPIIISSQVQILIHFFFIYIYIEHLLIYLFIIEDIYDEKTQQENT
jgi:hypothetical protein